ncbi:hypothetical protein TNCV_2309491 [Trichonephila clavipes]|nr:hypothetical protein TNCV_2309491 [Trichonephila clavipes]
MYYSQKLTCGVKRFFYSSRLLNGTGCLEGGNLVALHFANHLCSWDVLTGIPSATVHSTFCDPLLPTPSNYHIAPTEVAADTSIRPTCFSEAYGPYQSVSAQSGRLKFSKS